MPGYSFKSYLENSWNHSYIVLFWIEIVFISVENKLFNIEIFSVISVISFFLLLLIYY